MADDAPRERWRRLAQDANLWLATVRPDGRPHLTPIWFVFHDDRFWVCTGVESVKVRNVRADGRVALSLEDGTDPIVAEGIAVTVDRPYPAGVVDAFEAKFGWDISLPTDPDIGETLLLRIDVARWVMGDPTG